MSHFIDFVLPELSVQLRQVPGGQLSYIHSQDIMGVLPVQEVWVAQVSVPTLGLHAVGSKKYAMEFGI